MIGHDLSNIYLKKKGIRKRVSSYDKTGGNDDRIYIKPNELDKQKEYINTNIKFTKQAYGIDIDEIEIANTGTITVEDIDKNPEVIDNINIYNKSRVLSHLEEYQTNLGYYTFENTRYRIV